MISIIVPVYNKAKYLDKCLNSVLEQTYKDLEIILVDDGSKDNSLSICEDYAKRDNRIKVFHKENGGAASARNLGLDNSKGEYIGFVDADDFIDSSMYEELLALMVDNNLKMIDSGRRTISEDYKVLREDAIAEPLVIQTGEEAIKDLLLWRGNCSFCTRLYKREIFEKIRFPEGKTNEDFRLFVDIHRQFNQNPICNKVFYNVVAAADSVTRATAGVSKSLYDVIYYGDEVFDIAVEEYPTLIKPAWFFRFYTRFNLLVNLDKKTYMENKDYFRELQGWLRQNIKYLFNNPFMKADKKILLFLSSFNVLLLHKIYVFIKRN